MGPHESAWVRLHAHRLIMLFSPLDSLSQGPDPALLNATRVTHMAVDDGTTDTYPDAWTPGAAASSASTAQCRSWTGFSNSNDIVTPEDPPPAENSRAAQVGIGPPWGASTD